MASHRRGLGPARLQNLADSVGIIFQLADPPEAIAICGRIPFVGGIVDFYLPAGEGQASAAVELVAGQAARIIIGIGDGGNRPSLSCDI